MRSYPRNYTAIVRGANNTTGIAVVEVYALNWLEPAASLGSYPSPPRRFFVYCTFVTWMMPPPAIYMR